MNRNKILDTRNTVKGLCKLANELDYHDPFGYGRLDNDCCLGDLLEFFEDNPGAVDAVIEWVAEFYGSDEEEEEEEEEEE